MNQIKTMRNLQKSNSVTLRMVAASSNSDDGYPNGPFSCIAENLIWVSDAASINLRAIFVSSRGDIVIILRDRSDLSLAKTMVGNWNLASLDELCENYTFKVYSQAFRVVDLLAKNGRLSFSMKDEFEKRVLRNLKSGKICFFIME